MLTIEQKQKAKTKEKNNHQIKKYNKASPLYVSICLPKHQHIKTNKLESNNKYTQRNKTNEMQEYKYLYIYSGLLGLFYTFRKIFTVHHMHT